VAQIARHYITGPDIPEALLDRVEHGIRCYDPCMRCSTHAAGQMPLRVQCFAADGKVLMEAGRG
jgi:NAD-reducing hydrogenase large subunit